MMNAISNTCINERSYPVVSSTRHLDGKWRLLRRPFRRQFFQSPRLAVVGVIKRHATISLSFFKESCAACSSLKVEDGIVIRLNYYFY
jgi:hypothetical protein